MKNVINDGEWKLLMKYDNEVTNDNDNEERNDMKKWQ